MDVVSFSLTRRAKQWYAHIVGGVNGNWNELQVKFGLTFFPPNQVIALRKEIIDFEQKEKETLGAAWARFINTGPDLS